MAETTIAYSSGGLSPDHWKTIRQILEQQMHVDEAILFGSRAKGNYKEGSDIDIAVKGVSLDRQDIIALSARFEDSLLPYFVDILSYSAIQNEALKEHVDRIGILVYKRPAL